MVAELPDVRADWLPVPIEAPGQLFGRPHSYGVAHDLERMRNGFAPPPRTPRIQTRAQRHRSGPWTALRRRWANSDTGPVDLWHRFRCRTGHHEYRGGHQMQLGNRFVYVERRCRFCDTQP